MLLIHSKRDFVPPAHSTELAAAERRLGHQDITVRTLEGASHGGALMRQTEKLVLRWLSKHA
jgi:hypothetical protein